MKFQSNTSCTTSGNESGTAFVIILWLVAILGALVSAFAMTAIHSNKIVNALNRAGVSEGIAQAGRDIWLAQLRDDTLVSMKPGANYSGGSISWKSGIDAYTASGWGWPAELPGGSGVTLADKIWYPSLETSRQSGDVGYIEFLRIEDETGKMDIRHVSDTQIESPTEPGATGGLTMGAYNYHIDPIVNRNNDEWLTPGDILYVSESWWDRVYRYDQNSSGSPTEQMNYNSTMFSPYRAPNDPNRPVTASDTFSDGKINANSAPRSALASICIGSCNDSDESNLSFPDEGDVGSVIESRSDIGSYDVNMKTFADGLYPELQAQYYPTTLAGSEFTSANDACSNGFGFTATELALCEDQITVQSEGIFTVEVRGVFKPTPDSKPASSIIRFVADRKPLMNGNGPIEIITTRVKDEEKQGYDYPN